ncbi:hypothetical protein BK022_16215 [Methylorubrum extorquens]|uniref:Uncharacterized protein n=1 Tax=Methylorubrum extorquens TaxID=408 RepID=A0A1S1P7I4_METEX|nr:hypothetical protein BK022_16215 [Methylorubrum extorquens]
MRKPAPPTVMPLIPASPEPSFPALTAEDRAAILHYAKALCPDANPAHDSLWSAYICEGAVHTCIDVPLTARWRDRGCSAVVRVTRTRLGYTAGFWLQGPGYSRGAEGFTIPMRISSVPISGGTSRRLCKTVRAGSSTPARRNR